MYPGIVVLVTGDRLVIVSKKRTTKRLVKKNIGVNYRAFIGFN